MKIIASDYDGTLNHGGIDEKKRSAIKRWQNAGNLFGIVSGRGASDLLELHKSKNLGCDFLVGCNGAVIMKPDGTVLAESRCNGSLARPLLEFIFGIGCQWATVHSDSKYVIDLDDNERLEYEFTLETLPEVTYFNQINTRLPDEKEAERVTSAIREKFGDKLNPLQNGICIDIVSAEMNKAAGLYRLLEIVRADYGDIITVGDNINDTHMIAEFRSYAMENAVQSIKDIATDITPGITELIEKEM